MYKLRELRSSEHLSVYQRLLLVLVLTRTQSGCTAMPRRCFISIVLIRTIPDRLSRPTFAMISPFCLAKSALWILLLGVLLLNWIHSKIISGATFGIIGLTKISIFSVDWIYHSILIITVCFLYSHVCKACSRVAAHLSKL